MSKHNDYVVLVAGDVHADWLLFEMDEAEKGKSNNHKIKDYDQVTAWKSEQRIFIAAVHGGAWIVERFLRMLLPISMCKNIYTYERFNHHKLRSGDSRHVIHQFTTLKKYPKDNKNDNKLMTYRAVPKGYRFTGPQDENDYLHPMLLPDCMLRNNAESVGEANDEGHFSEESKTPSGEESSKLSSGASKVVNAVPDGTDVDESELKAPAKEMTGDIKDANASCNSNDELCTWENDNRITCRYFPGDKRLKRIIVLYDRGNGFWSNNDNGVMSDGKGCANIAKEDWKYLFYCPQDNNVDKYRSLEVAELANIEHIVLSVKNPSVPIKEYTTDDSAKTGNKIVDFIINNEMLGKTSFVIDADDLRKDGAHITRGASWERTAEDTYKLFSLHPFLRAIEKAHKVVIRFGVSGAVVRMQGNGLDRYSIVFDPKCHEQGYADTSAMGVMYPMDAVMTSSLAASIYENLSSGTISAQNPPEECLDNVKLALERCRNYYDHGVNIISKCTDSSKSRGFIEQWDTDSVQDNCPKVPAPRNVERKSTQIGAYSGYDWKEDHTTEMLYDVFINDEGEFGRLYTDGRVSRVICSMVCNRLFKGIINELLNELMRTEVKGVKKEVFSIKTGEYEGRNSRVQGMVGLNLDCEISDLNNYFNSLHAKIKKICSDESDAHCDELKKKQWESLSSRVEKDGQVYRNAIAEMIQMLVMHNHAVVSQDYHNMLFAPVVLNATRSDHFCSHRIAKEFQQNWVMLPTDKQELIQISKGFVKYGYSKNMSPAASASISSNFAIAQFGKMTIVDRSEIETFRSLYALMKNYLKRKNPDRPLCAAVFGPPGSGKSFGVKQLGISSDIPANDVLEFNVSQFESRLDLERALLNVRNVCTPNRTPLVFFDEFDSDHKGEPLGWLKMFLSVMQDGTFAFGGDIMQLGKSILIFAGGTCDNFNQFSRSASKPGSTEYKYFREIKGPDFVSRLRGYIDIAGINPPDVLDVRRCFHYLRRAAIIRTVIEREYPDMIDGNGQAKIDEGVLNALICVSRYTHGARSLSALFDMSNLAGRDSFERSHLPSEHQLAMHLECTDTHDGVQEFIGLLNSK